MLVIDSAIRVSSDRSFLNKVRVSLLHLEQVSSMSYNTRRTNMGYNTLQQSNAVGQRRPPVNSSFVSGGQLSGSQQKPIMKGPQAPLQQRVPQTPQRPIHQTGLNFNSQTQQNPPNQQTPINQQQQARAQPAAATPVQQKPTTTFQQKAPTPLPAKPNVAVPQKPTTSVPVPPAPVAAPAPVSAPVSAPVTVPAPVSAPEVKLDPAAPSAEAQNPSLIGPSEEAMEVDTKKKLFWKKGNKISKAEKLRKRNLRLSKILQPKSAIMILNELVKGCVYNVEELPIKTDAAHFRSIVNFDGQEFAGTGRTKSLARNAAAERALKYLVKNKKMTPVKKEEEDGDWKMDVDAEDNQTLPWSHIASFAMYKLFSTWGEDRLFQKDPSDPSDLLLKVSAGPKEPKPAKKMPENPETMNPLMLMHQMMPTAVWEEVESKGNPPNVIFTFSLTIDGKQFIGSGSSKKAAKKLAAFSACHEVLQVQYPADIWTPV